MNNKMLIVKLINKPAQASQLFFQILIIKNKLIILIKRKIKVVRNKKINKRRKNKKKKCLNHIRAIINYIIAIVI